MLSEILNLIQDQTDQDPQSEDPDLDQVQDRGPGRDRVRVLARERPLQPNRLGQGVVLQVVAAGGLEVAVVQVRIKEFKEKKDSKNLFVYNV